MVHRAILLGLHCKDVSLPTYNGLRNQLPHERKHNEVYATSQAGVVAPHLTDLA
jgi:hypothetical protein